MEGRMIHYITPENFVRMDARIEETYRRRQCAGGGGHYSYWSELERELELLLDLPSDRQRAEVETVLVLRREFAPRRAGSASCGPRSVRCARRRPPRMTNSRAWRLDLVKTAPLETVRAGADSTRRPAQGTARKARSSMR
jgi:hypothetical protein